MGSTSGFPTLPETSPKSSCVWAPPTPWCPVINPSPSYLHGFQWLGAPARKTSPVCSKPDGCLPGEALHWGPSIHPPQTYSQSRRLFASLAQRACPPHPPFGLLDCPRIPVAAGFVPVSKHSGVPTLAGLLLWSVTSPLPSRGDSEPSFRSLKPPTALSFRVGTCTRVSQGPEGRFPAGRGAH